jgi:Ca-activated chloride channel homolog
MNIVNPVLLFLLIILLPLAGLVFVVGKRFRKRFGAFAEQGFWEYYFRDWSFFFLRLKAVLLITALAFIVIALVRPQWDRETHDIKRSGLDIAICVDASKSMDATDIAPTRLQRAKDQISAFIDEQEGDRIALIPFAGTAFVQCPLTDDYDAAKMLLSSLNSNSVPIWGTDIGKALSEAKTVFDKNTKTRVVVLISDGEDLNDSAVREARSLAQEGIIVYVMGVGTPEGAGIRLSAEDLPAGYSGQEIISKLDNKTLAKIAETTGGEFFMITPAQDEIQAILKHIASLEKSKLSSRRMSIYKEQYGLFAIGALLLLLLETVLMAGTRRIKEDSKAKAVKAAGLLLILFLFPVFSLQALTLPWSKAMTNSKGNAAYNRQDFQQAEETFGKNSAKYPDDEALHFNLGNARYRLKQGSQASENWEKAINSSNPALRSKAWQNLGNLQYEQKQYKEAMQSFGKAVLADEKNTAARENYDLAKRRLIQQQQRQNQNQQNQDSQREQSSSRQDRQQKEKQDDAERILQALEQKEVNDRQNRQGTPQRMLNNKWW